MTDHIVEVCVIAKHPYFVLLFIMIPSSNFMKGVYIFFQYGNTWPNFSSTFCTFLLFSEFFRSLPVPLNFRFSVYKLGITGCLVCFIIWYCNWNVGDIFWNIFTSLLLVMYYRLLGSSIIWYSNWNVSRTIPTSFQLIFCLKTDRFEK